MAMVKGLSDEEFRTRLGEVIRTVSFRSSVVPDPDSELGCKHCGRVVLCGPPCCDGMAADVKAYQESPEYVELVRKQQEEGKRQKAETKAAKRGG